MFDLLNMLADGAGAEKGVFRLEFIYDLASETVIVQTTTGVCIASINLKILGLTIAHEAALKKKAESDKRVQDELDKRKEQR